MTDPHLLTAYQQTPSPELFSKLVNTYINLVFSVARRSTKDTHLAQDITQEVFLTLARKAPTLEPSTPLATWLFTTTRNISMQTLRAASRRSKHESEAAMSHQPPAQPDPLWPLIAEEIDSAVADLPPADSGIILLRYFANHSTAQVATALSISEDAAKKRLQRALESLEKLLTSRGFAACTALTLAAALTAHAVHAAPATLATSITSALTTKSAALLTTKGTLMAATKIKTALLLTAALLLTTTAATAIYFSNRTAPASALTAALDTSNSSAVEGISAIDYRTIYSLRPGQTILHIPAAPPEARAAVYQQMRANQHMPMGKVPEGLLLGWKDSQIDGGAISLGWGFPGGSLLTFFFDIHSPELVSPFKLPDLPGDFVYRIGASSEQDLADFQSILTNYLHKPITCSLRDVSKEAIVLRGDFHYSPLSNAFSTVRGAIPTLSLYLHQTAIVPGALSNYVDSPRAFAGPLSDLFDQPVIIECTNFPPHLQYLIQPDVQYPLHSAEEVSLLLQHITEQTGLTVSRETRPIRCLVIESPSERIAPPTK